MDPGLSGVDLYGSWAARSVRWAPRIGPLAVRSGSWESGLGTSWGTPRTPTAIFYRIPRGPEMVSILLKTIGFEQFLDSRAPIGRKVARSGSWSARSGT